MRMKLLSLAIAASLFAMQGHAASSADTRLIGPRSAIKAVTPPKADADTTAIIECLWKDSELHVNIVEGTPAIYKVSSSAWQFWETSTKSWRAVSCSYNDEEVQKLAPSLSIEITGGVYRGTCNPHVDYVHHWTHNGRAMSSHEAYTYTRIIQIDRQTGEMESHVLFKPDDMEDQNSAEFRDTAVCKKTVDPASLLPKPAL